MARIFDSARDFDRATGASVEERLVRLERLATLMDAALVVPGTNIRFGADAVIGLIPGAGDLVSAAISSLIVLEARRMGAPGHLVARMVGNIAIDGAVGTVPVLGDIFDVAFRANLRNVRLLRKHFEKTDRL
ncbi:MAG: DUF4112 domain-containing protein [Xanthobacteraceae bacterium]|nr:DUF4112 domain-containing protein [Xanthobacteraceae bacterium]QYK44346.1 MAG: DUF4112 domain-containing protein [Xanthobacteraceae bacterium]